MEFGFTLKPDLSLELRVESVKLTFDLLVEIDLTARPSYNREKFLGYDAEVVESGHDAVDRFKRAKAAGRPFDAVMLDLVVPRDLGGREAIGMLTALDPAVRAILVSGYAQDEAMSSFRDYGFAAAMTKPYTLQELRVTLETVITSPTCRVH